MSKKNGKPCKKCGTSEWYESGHCRQCAKNTSAEWKIKNPEKRLEIIRQWNQRNRDKNIAYKREYNSRQDVKERNREYQKLNREAHRRANQKYRQRNKDKIATNIWNYRQRNKERVRGWARLRYHSNPEKAREIYHRRRFRLATNGGNFSAAEWRDLCALYDNKCLYPGCESAVLTVDHVVPLSKGGTNDLSNIQPLCSFHNTSKGDKTIDYRYKPGLEHWTQPPLL